MLLLSLLASVVYAALHLVNNWLAEPLSLSPSVSLVYLPSFLRLTYALVFGALWGTVATVCGTLLAGILLSKGGDMPLVLLNALASGGSAVIAIAIWRRFSGRDAEICSLVDLTQLAVLFALCNSTLHHLVWYMTAPSPVVTLGRMLVMAIGDLNGVLIGAAMLRWLSLHTRSVPGFGRWEKAESARGDSAPRISP